MNFPFQEDFHFFFKGAWRAMISLKSIQIRALDKIATERFGIPGLLLMENASMGIARFLEKRANGAPRKILVLCGKGNNGGDGFATARHLHNSGMILELVLIGTLHSLREGSDVAINAGMARRMGIPLHECPNPESIMDVLRREAHDIY